MATRKGVAASIAAAVLFSSLVVSNFVIFSGAAEDFRLVSLATQERGYHTDAALVTSISVLDLLDGVQELLSSTRFYCSNATDAVGSLLGSEVVRLRWTGIGANSTLALAPDLTVADNLSSLSPFDGSVAGIVNFRTLTLLHGSAADGSVQYQRSEAHLLSIPLRLESLSEHCLDAGYLMSSALRALGPQLCNSTAVSESESTVASVVSRSAAADGFAVTLTYSTTPGPRCEVSYLILAEQQGIAGPEGPFTFAETEPGYVQT